MDDDEEPATLDGQFYEFAKFMDTDGDVKTITLYQSDYWLRQGEVLDDRNLTMTDTGLAWMKYSKTELTYDEWYEMLTNICISKKLDQNEIEAALTNCGIPGSVRVNVPQYRDFFDTYKPISKLVY